MRDPKHWQNMAEEIRTCAENMQNEKCKQQLYNCADMYERLAEYADYLQIKKKNRTSSKSA